MQGAQGSIPSQETRSHVPQLKILRAAMQTEDPSAATKTRHSQINKEIYILKNYMWFLTNHGYHRGGGGKERGKEKWRKEGEIRSIGLRDANYYT